MCIAGGKDISPTERLFTVIIRGVGKRRYWRFKAQLEQDNAGHPFHRGLDDWQPIAAAPHGNAYYLMSGHRRHMAQLLAFALRDWAQEHPDTEIAIEVVRTILNTLVDSLGSREKVIGSLLTKYGDEEISFVTFESSQKAQILALQATNYGSEKPDALGVAPSFRQAVEAGAAPEEIARNAGQHVNFVHNHLALTEIPPELAHWQSEQDMATAVERFLKRMSALFPVHDEI